MGRKELFRGTGQEIEGAGIDRFINWVCTTPSKVDEWFCVTDSKVTVSFISEIQ